MPKIKTNRGAVKRFKLTGSGKIKCRRANRNHILTKEKSSVKRKRRTLGLVSPGDMKSIKRLINQLKSVRV